MEEIELEIEKREKKIEEIEEDILNKKGGRVESSTVHGEEDEPWEVEE